MAKCAECLYQGDKNKDKEGNSKVFCLVRGQWTKIDGTCDAYRDDANLTPEIRNQFASEIRQERSENRRLTKIFQKNLKAVIVVLVLSFVLFIAAVKFFEKYIF